MSSPRLLKGRRSEVGYYYSITTNSLGRKPLFRDPSFAKAVTAEIFRAEDCGDVSSIAWVLMPDHLHWLFCLRTGSLSAVVQKMKCRSANAINAGRCLSGSVWQAGFYDRRLGDEESLHRQARYLIENPLRAGLAQSIEEYPYWWCAWVRSRSDQW
jgi:putative transposase